MSPQHRHSRCDREASMKHAHLIRFRIQSDASAAVPMLSPPSATLRPAYETLLVDRCHVRRSILTLPVQKKSLPSKRDILPAPVLPPEWSAFVTLTNHHR
eukprot:CAMPEP_0185841422 /NCGR_PEP_ID=MMETSP1353-20130828/17884_1 /TAXON_ID=1077150 /ORGANISM="Erythrolobus australicus, Strain CCMP3124" /LENGTH=99 /DNA_ID=CAMNT_0028540893 /DNA_START=544 /DNA_END=839 /DNA_ORIENTATION=-